MSQGVILCLVNGPWQALSLVASLRQLELSESGFRRLVCLVDMEDGSPLHQATVSILKRHGLREQYTLAKTLPTHAFADAARALERTFSVALDTLSIVATYGTHRPLARFLISLTGRAQILVYEEGLRTYVPTHVSARERARVRLAQTWGALDRNFGRAWTFPDEAGRDIAFCLLLGERVALPKNLHTRRVHLVEERHLRAAVMASHDVSAAETALRVPAQERQSEPHYVVIVGQYYARLKQMSEQAEIDAYARAACSIARRGQTPVWRGHIREHDHWFDLLKRRCPSLRDFRDVVDDATLPLELYASFFSRSKVSAVSFSSSALFYLRYVYGIDTHTLATDEIVAAMSYPHRDACLIAQRYIPRFEV